MLLGETNRTYSANALSKFPVHHPMLQDSKVYLFVLAPKISSGMEASYCQLSAGRSTDSTQVIGQLSNEMTDTGFSHSPWPSNLWYFLNVANHTRRSRFLLRRMKDFVWFCPRLLVGTSLSARPCRVSQCESDQAVLEVVKKPWVPVDWDFVESGQQTLDTSSMAEPANGVCIANL